MVVAPIKTSPVVIFGAFGMLGHALQQVFPEALYKGRDLDITDDARVRAFLMDIKPAIVINAAAYTDVEGCEENREPWPSR